MIIRGLKKACLAIAIVAVTACDDSTGSGTVSSEDALRSLNRGFGEAGGLPFGLGASSLGGGADLGTVDVTIDGTSQRMYALGMRMTFPSGTCEEDVFVFPGDTREPGECTPPPVGVMLVLWQTRSGSRPPDRMIFLSADVGTSDFGFPEIDPMDLTVFPAFAFFIDRGGQRFWGSTGGTLTSQVTATNQTCDVTPPPFAASSNCHFATFDEAGQVTFEEFDFESSFGTGSAPRTMELVIPRQNILGIWHAITAVKPVVLFPGSALRGF